MNTDFHGFFYWVELVADTVSDFVVARLVADRLLIFDFGRIITDLDLGPRSRHRFQCDRRR